MTVLRSDIKYQNASDTSGKVVNIDEVTPESRANMRFSCIGCGREMVAVLGKKNKHHFRHKEEVTCNEETYLHRLTKRILKEKFDSEAQFIVKYHVPIECPISAGCSFNDRSCSSMVLKPIDLKQFYDTCEEEVSYSGFRADLMLSHSGFPNRKPVFLEVAVTHDCEQEKVNSLIPIIEIKIRSEEDVNKIKTNSLIESECPPKSRWRVDRKMSDKTSLPVRFYNFKRKAEREGAHFYMIPNKHGGYYARCKPNTMYCCASVSNDDAYSQFDVWTHGDVIPQRRYDRLYGLGIAVAQKRGFNVKHCLLCKPTEDCDIISGAPRIEYLPKYDVSIDYQGFDLNDLSSSEIEELQAADICSRYKFSEAARERIIESFRDIPYWIRTPEMDEAEPGGGCSK